MPLFLREAVRRDKAKVLMPQDTNSIPLDDEDILDLTVVAEPGNSPATSDGPPEPGSDFGADLDALLDSLGADGSVAAPAAPPASPVAAPIADQTPADHVVDPNEEIAMPETADIDSLLAELGADIPIESAPPAEAAAEEPAAAPMPEFDGILAQAQAAEAQKAAEEAAPAAPADPFEAAQAAAPAPADPFEAAQAAAPAPAEAADPFAAAEAAAAMQAAPAAPADPFEAAQAAEAAPAPVAPATPVADEAPAAPGEPSADEAENLDLNELDALLDDILATAPEMSVPAAAPQPETAPPAAPADAAEVLPVPEQALMPAGDDASLLERIQNLEDAVATLEAQDGIPEAMIAALIESKINAALVPGSPVMTMVVNAVLTQLTASGEADPSNAAFRESLEKMAAAAAAKVIREEIAAIMNE